MPEHAFDSLGNSRSLRAVCCQMWCRLVRAALGWRENRSRSPNDAKPMHDHTGAVTARASASRARRNLLYLYQHRGHKCLGAGNFRRISPRPDNYTTWFESRPARSHADCAGPNSSLANTPAKHVQQPPVSPGCRASAHDGRPQLTYISKSQLHGQWR